MKTRLHAMATERTWWRPLYKPWHQRRPKHHLCSLMDAMHHHYRNSYHPPAGRGHAVLHASRSMSRLGSSDASKMPYSCLSCMHAV